MVSLAGGLAGGRRRSSRIAREALRAATRMKRDELARRASASTPTSRATSCFAPAARSTYYLDKYRFETRPDLLGRARRAASPPPSPSTSRTRSASPAPELGAVALAAAASLVVRPAVPDRPQGGEGVRHREPARRRLRAGRAGLPRRGRRHLRRGRGRGASTPLREAGLECRIAVCVVDREEGGADALARRGEPVLRPLFRAGDLLSDAKNCRKTAWLSRNRLGLLGSRPASNNVQREERT